MHWLCSVATQRSEFIARWDPPRLSLFVRLRRELLLLDQPICCGSQRPAASGALDSSELYENN